MMMMILLLLLFCHWCIHFIIQLFIYL